jgi:Fe-S oxidoreductase
MWMEERIGKRINTERVQEALSTGAHTVAVGCPFCMTMLSDGVNSVGPGQAEVVDVATVLLNTIKRGEPSTAAPTTA